MNNRCPNTEENSEVVDYSSMKVAELKELLKEKNLPVSGTKSELIERLQTWVQRPGSFYHSGSHSRREIKFGQLYFYHYLHWVLISGIGTQIIEYLIGFHFGFFTLLWFN